VEKSYVSDTTYLVLPPRTKITNTTAHGTSHWASCFRIETLSSLATDARNGHDDVDGRRESRGNPYEKNEKGGEQDAETRQLEMSYFIKIVQGKNGKSMLRGECESAADLQRISPGFGVKGIAWGVFEQEDGNDDYKDDGDAEEDNKWYFYIQNFIRMRQPTTADMQTLVDQLADFHIKSSARFEELTSFHRIPGTYFGYHVPTHNGKLEQDNIWTSTWEEYFLRNMKTMLAYDEKEGGPRPQEIEELLHPLFNDVIPKLLRPMETQGRRIAPSLCHGDLWEGNVGVVEHGEEEGAVVIFDPACFWGHGECMSIIFT
jgi:protein-ribulosamine 3-kinase